MAPILKPHRLGELLVLRGLISAATLAQALQRQRYVQKPLGHILVRLGALSESALLTTLATQRGIPFHADDAPWPATLTAPQAADSTHYHQLNALPCYEQHGVLHVASCAPNAQTERWFASRYPQHALAWHVVSQARLRQLLSQQFGASWVQDAAEKVVRIGHEHSAKRTLLDFQRALLVFFALLLVAASLLNPRTTALAVWGVLELWLLGTVAFKAWLLLRGWWAKPLLMRLAGWDGGAWRSHPDARLPSYSVLVPLYDEAAVIPALLERLQRLDYPRELLDIKLIVEADDTATRAAIAAHRLPAAVDVVVVPASEPRTKPKACNYALRFAQGQLVTIFDAEDAPEPHQLRLAAWAFHHSGGEVACLQAGLNWYNADANLLTRWFALEYGMWFMALLRGLEHGRFPIPLGGTSNHFRRYALEHVGGWDAYNVTEDADLGMRLARFGYQTRLLPSHTLEEAPEKLAVWVRQRTRWIKGYMQTWCVHMRQPAWLRWHLGWRHGVGFHLFIGGPCLLHVCTPLLVVLSLGLLPALPASVRQAAWGLMAASAVVHLLVAMALYGRLAPLIGLSTRAPLRWRLAQLAFPLYWLLHALASLRALWQLVWQPHRWEKSPHGVTKHGVGGPQGGFSHPQAQGMVDKPCTASL